MASTRYKEKRLDENMEYLRKQPETFRVNTKYHLTFHKEGKPEVQFYPSTNKWVFVDRKGKNRIYYGNAEAFLKWYRSYKRDWIYKLKCPECLGENLISSLSRKGLHFCEDCGKGWWESRNARNMTITLDGNKAPAQFPIPNNNLDLDNKRPIDISKSADGSLIIKSDGRTIHIENKVVISKGRKNLMAWRVAALRRIEKAVEVLDTLISRQEDLISTSLPIYSSVIEPYVSDPDPGDRILPITVTELKSIRDTLMGNNAETTED